MSKLEYVKKLLDRFYIDKTEWLKLNPSYYLIESYSESLLKIISELKDENKGKIMDSELHSLWRNADIFNADYSSELFHDFEKGNKRYREKWIEQKGKIDKITFKLYDYLKDKY